jgi:hypothetical protein
LLRSEEGPTKKSLLQAPTSTRPLQPTFLVAW